MELNQINKSAQFICTEIDDCLFYPMDWEEVIECYFKEQDSNEDVIFCGKNMKDLFEEAINNYTMNANDWQTLKAYMSTINLCTKEGFVMNVFENYELDVENSDYCSITEKSFLATINHSSEKYFELIEQGDDIPTDIAALLAKYAEKKYGDKWDYWWTEGDLRAYNTATSEYRDGDIYPIE